MSETTNDAGTAVTEALNAPVLEATPAAPVATEAAPALPEATASPPAPDDAISTAFKNMLLYDLAESSYYRDKEGKPSEYAKRVTTDALTSFAPRDAQEGMTASLLIQLYNSASDHYRLATLPRFHSRPYEYLEMAVKLTRAYASLLDAFNHSRDKGISKQEITVQHVHIHDGAQAVIGDVNRTAQGGVGNNEK